MVETIGKLENIWIHGVNKKQLEYQKDETGEFKILTKDEF